MSNIWFTSDTHFNHVNILRFTDRKSGELIRSGFDDVNDMNETMIDRWNEVVRPGDKVYHLGDVIFGSKESRQTWMDIHWNRLMGSKRLIVGNHDDIPFLAQGGWFKKIQMWRDFGEHNFLCSHVPIHQSELVRGVRHSNPPVKKTRLNVFGHIHQNPAPPGPYKCVCVEHTDYRPVHIDELIKAAKNME